MDVALPSSAKQISRNKKNSAAGSTAVCARDRFRGESQGLGLEAEWLPSTTNTAASDPSARLVRIGFMGQFDRESTATAGTSIGIIGGRSGLLVRVPIRAWNY